MHISTDKPTNQQANRPTNQHRNAGTNEQEGWIARATRNTGTLAQTDRRTGERSLIPSRDAYRLGLIFCHPILLCSARPALHCPIPNLLAHTYIHTYIMQSNQQRCAVTCAPAIITQSRSHHRQSVVNSLLRRVFQNTTTYPVAPTI